MARGRADVHTREPRVRRLRRGWRLVAPERSSLALREPHGALRRLCGVGCVASAIDQPSGLAFLERLAEKGEKPMEGCPQEGRDRPPRAGARRWRQAMDSRGAELLRLPAERPAAGQDDRRLRPNAGPLRLADIENVTDELDRIRNAKSTSPAAIRDTGGTEMTFAQQTARWHPRLRQLVGP